MDRLKVEIVLSSLGVPDSSVGFMYIVDVMEVFEERGTNIGITKELYPTVAKRRKTTSSRVERAIRYALSVARKVGAENLPTYLGETFTSNSNTLKYFYRALKINHIL